MRRVDRIENVPLVSREKEREKKREILALQRYTYVERKIVTRTGDSFGQLSLIGKKCENELRHRNEKEKWDMVYTLPGTWLEKRYSYIFRIELKFH